MRIAFRTDASLEIGTGHVMRCLALADALSEHGAQCTFICRPHNGNLLSLIDERGYRVLILTDLQKVMVPHSNCSGHAAWLGVDWKTDAYETLEIIRNNLGYQPLDWLVVDHYALDNRWEHAMRSQCRQIMVIDDLADRLHDCELLLDQNLGRVDQDYAGLATPKTVKLIGARYALLRAEFRQWRSYSLERRKKGMFKSLLISMGGVDKDNATGCVLGALAKCNLPQDLCITVVIGRTAPWLSQVLSQASQMRWPTQVLVDVNNMAQIMANSDVAIGGAGSTSWERCCLGLPTIQIALADNQKFISNALDKAGAAIALSFNEIQRKLPVLIAGLIAEKKLNDISNNARKVTAGDGAILVANEIMNMYENHNTLQ